MQVVGADFKVIKRGGQAVHPRHLAEGDEILYGEDGETAHTVISVDSDAVLIALDDSVGLICLSQSFADRENERRADPAFVVPAAGDENDDAIDRSGVDGDAEGAALGGWSDFQDRVKAVGDKALLPFKKLGQAGVTLAGENLPNFVNPFTGQGVLKNFYEDVAFNVDIVTTNKSKTISYLDDLRPGDILLKQLSTKLSLDSGLITGCQVAFNSNSHRYLGASLLTHAVMYIGNGRVVEAVSNGVGVSSLETASDFNGDNYKNYSFYVIRCKHADIVKEALNVAKTLIPRSRQNLFDAGNKDVFKAGDKVKVAYSFGDLYAEITKRAGMALADCVSLGFGHEAVAEAYDRIFAKQDKTSMFAAGLERAGDDPGKDGQLKLFCSELQVYCYHRAVDLSQHKSRRDRLFQGLRQNDVSPEQIYVLAREDKANFEYVGELSPHQRAWRSQMHYAAAELRAFHQNNEH